MALLPVKTFLVDDNEIDLFIQKRFLEVFQFTNDIVSFSSAKEAIASIQDLQPKQPLLVFLDLNMPDMDGFGFLEALGQLPENNISNLQVVVITSSNSQTDFEKAFSFGRVIHFIVKPLKQADLMVVKEKINSRR
jgi:two-component system, NarL family, nitrate/nitrite response regulator NarL